TYETRSRRSRPTICWAASPRLIQAGVPHSRTFFVTLDATEERFAERVPRRFKSFKAEKLWSVHGESARVAGVPIGNSHREASEWWTIIESVHDERISLAAGQSHEAVIDKNRARSRFRIRR